MPTLAEAHDLFDRRRRAWLAEDVDGYLALWAEDMTFQSPVHAEPLRGRAAFATLVRQSLAFARPVAFEFRHIAVVETIVLAEWRIAVERRTERRVVAWDGMSVAEIRVGLIHRWREYWNPADVV
jgi:limonene-1,2-epoxide hydrolase